MPLRDEEVIFILIWVCEQVIALFHFKWANTRTGQAPTT